MDSTADGPRCRERVGYDVEVSGFPSSHSGHLILLGLTDQDYPGTSLIEDWPSWNLPVLRWAKEQNALVGYAHCGVGLSVGTEELPNYIVPSFQGIGSNEIVVDVLFGAADFQCGAQFAPAAELNIWYHLLSVGYRTLMLGETDYPCMYDEGPGVGRTYVRLAEPPSGPQAIEAWTTGLRESASYFGDGRSHVFDLAVDGDVSREHPLDSARPGAGQRDNGRLAARAAARHRRRAVRSTARRWAGISSGPESARPDRLWWRPC